jgi:hypothetical protein
MDEHHGEMQHTMPVDHAEACGYCVLLAHVRADACADRPAQRGAATAAVKPPRQAVSHWHFFPGFTLIPARRRAVCFFPLKNMR